MYHRSGHDIDPTLFEGLFSVCNEFFAEHGKNTGECFDESESHIGMEFGVPRLEVFLFRVRNDDRVRNGENKPRGSRVVRLQPRYLWGRRLRRPVGKVRSDNGKEDGHTMCNKRRFSSSLVPGKAAVSTQSKKRVFI